MSARWMGRALQVRRALCRVLEFCAQVTAVGEPYAMDAEHVRHICAGTDRPGLAGSTSAAIGMLHR
jgi:hypothetical protein